MNGRPAFLTGAGVVAGGVTLLAVLAWIAFGGALAFSPGALSAKGTAQSLGGVSSHAALGVRDCEACHTAPWSAQTMADRCLRCHADVRAEMSAHTGLHGRLVTVSSRAECRGCHTEHHGAAGLLTVLDPVTFPHDLTGYSLRGHRKTAKGAAVTCAQCHPAGIARFDEAVCASCHAAIDPAFMRQHEAAFGAGCRSCHNGSDRIGGDFDHDRLPFKLTGKHAGVACAKCHTDSSTITALRGTPQDCYACHANVDQHRGAFGRQCGQCHTPAGWGDARFDHSVFPVDHGNRERTPTCKTCHPATVSSYTCFGCHAHTPGNVVGEHEGRSAGELTDCIRCHRGGQREGGD